MPEITQQPQADSGAPPVRPIAFGTVGFFLTIVALALLLVCFAYILATTTLLLLSLGFLADSPNSIISTGDTIATDAWRLSEILIALSVPCLALGLSQHRRGVDTPRAFRRTIGGIIIGGMLIAVFLFPFAYFLLGNLLSPPRKPIDPLTLVNYGYTCDDHVCENLSVSPTTNHVSFTLINNVYNAGPITLTNLDDAGMCIGGILEHYRTDNQTIPTAVHSTGPFAIQLAPRQRVDIALQCQRIALPSEMMSTSGQVRFRFAQGNETQLSFHVYLGWSN